MPKCFSMTLLSATVVVLAPLCLSGLEAKASQTAPGYKQARDACSTKCYMVEGCYVSCMKGKGYKVDNGRHTSKSTLPTEEEGQP